MDDSILITASLRIERPAAEVRAQYRDIDHHIRNNVHPSIHYQWEPGAPGERKIRTTFRILGIPQYDVSLLEDDADGSFLIRYLEGTNAGMLLVHRFVSVGENATDVQLFANAPATLGRKLLGPLFVVGARQVMKKALIEDKRDLERGEFVADVAAGNLERALAPSLGLARRDSAVRRLALGAACLIAAADGDVDAAERDALGRFAESLGEKAASAWLETRLAEYISLAQTEQIATEADRIGHALLEADAAREGVTAAAVIGLTTQGLSLGELSLLRRLAGAAHVDEQAVATIVEDADLALMANPRS